MLLRCSLVDKPFVKGRYILCYDLGYVILMNPDYLCHSGKSDVVS